MMLFGTGIPDMGFGKRGSALAFPLEGDQTVLPATTELNEDALERPREVFHSESLDGRKSYLVSLGDMAFNAPAILGSAARQAGISCGTCHVNGAGNPKFFVPGMSARPGTFDTTGAFFNPKADNHVFDAVRIPSLRGIRHLGPYGHDGRTASLRDFVHDVIVGEFAGPEPSPAVLDAMVVYLQDIDFLPNQHLGPGGRLTATAGGAAVRGEAVFMRPFPRQPSLSCAGCHVPSAAFTDHRQHDVGSGGLFRTPTLRNANFNGPYFHDGRFDTYDQVIVHFDRTFDLGLSAQDRADLVAYLAAAGDGVLPYERDSGGARLKEIMDFSTVLDAAISEGDAGIVALAVDTIGGELRELIDHYPDRKNTVVSGGAQERTLARSLLKELVLALRRMDAAVADGHAPDAAAEFKTYSNLLWTAVPAVLTRASPWSLFNRSVHDAHYGALREVMQSKHAAR
jgi:cytochrome c peroxidase